MGDYDIGIRPYVDDVQADRNRPGRLIKSPANQQVVETAGIEPASAVARWAASTSVAGALISFPGRLAGGVAGNQPSACPRIGEGGPHRVSLLSDSAGPHRRRAGGETSGLASG